jgi:hypothetical protein
LISAVSRLYGKKKTFAESPISEEALRHMQPVFEKGLHKAISEMVLEKPAQGASLQNTLAWEKSCSDHTALQKFLTVSRMVNAAGKFSFQGFRDFVNSSEQTWATKKKK